MNPLGYVTQVSMSHHFVVTIDNPRWDLGTWYRVSGLQVKWKPCEYRVGDKGNQSWVLPGNTEYQNIKLSRAACSDSQVVQAWLASTSLNPVPHSGVIMLMDYGGVPVVHWRLNEFFPIAWQIVDLDADQAKPAIETLELAHTGFLYDESVPAPNRIKPLSEESEMPSRASLMSKASKTASASPFSTTTPPYGLAMRFQVTVNELVDLGEWSACKGLKVELKVTKVMSGGDYSSEWILPDHVSYSNITLERAVHPTDSKKVKKWLDDTISHWMNYNGSDKLYEGATAKITLLGAQGTEVMHWTLTGVYPVSWSGPSLSATENKIAIETLELAHEGFLGTE